MPQSALTGVENLTLRSRDVLPRRLFIIAGPSGVGKNTIIKNLLATYPVQLARVRTYTTREPREGEVDGAQYFFVSAEKFYELAQAGALMEVDGDSIGHDVYGLGKVYSIPSNPFQGIPPENHLVLAEVDVHGARLLKQHYPDAVLIFLTAPIEQLEERIESREDNTLTQGDLEQRIAKAYEHIQAAKDFDYVVINEEDRISNTVQLVSSIIDVERMRVTAEVDFEAAFSGSK